MVRKLAGLFIALGVVYSSAVGALGLGELTLDSYLNEPFKAKVDLLKIGNLSEDQIRIQLASRADFQRADIEREHILTNLVFATELDEAGNGVLHITTSQKLQEPYLNFIIEARWPTGRILREYTVLLDLPVFTENVAAIEIETAGIGNMRVPDPVSFTSNSATPVNATAGASQSTSIPGAIEASNGATHRVKLEETLWSIAGMVRPEDVSTHQTMLGIHRLNPRAFTDDNINQLKSGSVLRLPVRSQLSEQNFAEAVAEVAAHHQRWQQNLSGDLDSGGEDSAPQIDATGIDSAATGEEAELGPILKIATVDEQQGEGAEALQSEVVANLENLERAQRSNADLQMRLNAMDQQIVTLQRLLALKDAQIAALGEAVGGEGLVPAELAVDEPAILETDSVIAEQLVDQSVGQSANQSTGSATPTQRPQVPVPLEQPIVTPPSLLDQLIANLPYIAALLVLLIVVGGYGFYRVKGKRADKAADESAKADDNEFAGVELGDEELIVDRFSDDGSEDLSTIVAHRGIYEGDDSSVGYASQVETGDVLSEADIYIAYGRFPQAVDLLTEALVQNPENIEARLKLIEVDIEIGDLSAFRQDYANLQAIGDEAAMARAQALLQGFDNGEEWLEGLEGLAESNLSAEELEAAKLGQPAPDEAVPVVQEPVSSEPAVSEQTIDDEMLGTDLEIDDSGNSLEDDGQPLEDASLQLNVSDDEGLIDDAVESEAFEKIELDSDDSLLGEIDGSEEDLGLELQLDAEELGLDGLDTGADSDGLEFELGDVNENDVAEDTEEEFDFKELELGDDVEGDPATQLDVADSDEDLDDFDFSDIEIEGLEDEADDGADFSFESAGGLELPELDLPDVADVPGFEVDSDLESTTGMLSVDSDEVNTKLDLARAYIDMGDVQGARNILDEVMQEGSEGQLRKASELLERLD